MIADKVTMDRDFVMRDTQEYGIVGPGFYKIFPNCWIAPMYGSCRLCQPYAINYFFCKHGQIVAMIGHLPEFRGDISEEEIRGPHEIVDVVLRYKVTPNICSFGVRSSCCGIVSFHFIYIFF